jgi:hypothetical protein
LVLEEGPGLLTSSCVAEVTYFLLASEDGCCDVEGCGGAQPCSYLWGYSFTKDPDCTSYSFENDYEHSRSYQGSGGDGVHFGQLACGQSYSFKFAVAGPGGLQGPEVLQVPGAGELKLADQTQVSHATLTCTACGL